MSAPTKLRPPRAAKTYVLILLLCVSAVACSSVPAPRPSASAVDAPANSQGFPSLERWSEDFTRLRADALPVLISMNNYHMYLRSRSAQLSGDATDELYWDPPHSPNWAEIEPLLPPLRERSARLHAEIVLSDPNDSAWRSRRALAEATHHVVLMAEAMRDYYRATSALGPEEGGSATRELLVEAQRHFGRSEPAWRQAVSAGAERTARALDGVSSDHRALLTPGRQR